MVWLWTGVGIVTAALLATAGRLWSRRREMPCPSRLWWVLDSPFRSRLASEVIRMLDLSEGMHVLDAGCGPGRFSVPIARAVGSGGLVLAVDLQKAMLGRAKERADAAGLTNIQFLEEALGDGKVPAGTFDRALLVTVLGEILDRQKALREIYSALRPGGFLSVTEVLPDPHYLSMRTVKRLGTQAGFRIGRIFGSPFAFTIHLEKA